MYIERIVDAVISERLEISGGLLIEGPKACGKTTCGLNFSKSDISLDINPNAVMYMETNPELILVGDTPRLIDEWQIYANIWNYVRHEIDKRQKPGQFILTGSSTPKDKSKLHTGAGRILSIKMRTLSIYEKNREQYDNEKWISLEKICAGGSIKADAYDEKKLDSIIDDVLHGGFPGFIKNSTKNAQINIQGYVDRIINVDISEVDEKKRDPIGVKAVMNVLAKNVATYVTKEKIAIEAGAYLNRDIKATTVSDYTDALERLGVFERQQSWQPHLRARYSVRKSVKIHYCEPSIACALLGITKKQLMDDLKYFGFLFESFVYHNMKAYANASGGDILQYHDSGEVEVDQIYLGRNGTWGAFEVKLGAGENMLNEAAENLLKFAKKVDTDKMGEPGCLAIITGTGNYAYTRKDGVMIIPLYALKP
jgi:predicted AAA+ superfamily ATPase